MVVKTLPPPSLLVYLKAPVDILIDQSAIEVGRFRQESRLNTWGYWIVITTNDPQV